MTENPPPVLLMVPTDEEDIEMEKELSKTQSQGQNKFDSFFHSPKQIKSGSQVSSSPVIQSSGSMTSTGFENFQDVIKEQGVLVPLAVSVFKQFQNELAKFLNEKLSRFTGTEDIKDFDSFTNFRTLEWYHKSLRTISEVSKHIGPVMTKILLSWIPGGDQDLFAKTLAKKGKKNPPLTKKPKTHHSSFYLAAKEAIPPYPKWSFLSWTDTIQGFDPKNIDHMDIAEFVVLIAAGDILCITLRFCENLDKSIFNLLFNNLLELFTELPNRQYGVWLKQGMILDQWSYVVRRLSLIYPMVVVEGLKSRINLTKVTLTEPEIVLLLKAWRFLQVDLSKVEGAKEYLNFMIALANAFKKTTLVRESILENLDFFYRQLDFHVQKDAPVHFEKVTNDLVAMVKDWEKKCSGTFKRLILFFLSTTTVHLSMANFEKTIDESVSKLLKNYRKTTNIAGALESINRMFEDKLSFEPRHFLINSITQLESNEEFAAIVYHETRGATMFPFKIDESKEAQQADYAGYTMKKKFLTKIKESCSVVHADIFGGKTKPIVSSKEPVEEVIFYYVVFLIRLCAINLELGLKTLHTLINEKTKTWELFSIAIQVVSKLVKGQDSSNPEIKSILSTPNQQKMFSDFMKTNYLQILSIMKLCEDFVGMPAVGVSPLPFSVYSYKMKNQPTDDSGGNIGEDSTDVVVAPDSPVTSMMDMRGSFNNPNLSSEGEVDTEEKEEEPESNKSTLSYTGQSPEEVVAQKKKDDRVVQKKLALSAKSKKGNKIHYQLYSEILRLLPYLNTETLIKTRDLKVFLGTRLVYNDPFIARIVSNSLQQAIVESKDSSYIEGLVTGVCLLLEDQAYQEVSSQITLYDNINIVLTLFNDSRREEKNKNKEEMKKYWTSEKDLWIPKIEAHLLISLCHSDKKLRSSIFALFKAISEYVKIKRIPGLESEYNPKPTIHDVIDAKCEDIVQKAYYLSLLKDSLGVKEDISFPDDYPTLLDASQKDDQGLWSIVLSEIINALFDEKYCDPLDFVNQILKARLILLAPLEIIKPGSMDDAAGVKYANFLVLRMACSGIPDGGGNVDALLKIQSDLLLFANGLFKGFKSEIPWVRNMIVTATCSVHYYNVGVVCKALNDFIINQTKPKTKSRENLLYDGIIILNKISNHFDFKKCFMARSTPEKENATNIFAHLTNILKHFVQHSNGVEYQKLKMASSFVKNLQHDVYLTALYNNLAGCCENSLVPHILKDESIWTREERLNSVNFLQVVSGFHEKSALRKPKVLDTKKTPQDTLDKINTILPEKASRCSQMAISHILTLNPIFTEYYDISKQMEWFERAETRGYHTMASILYFHLDHLMEYFIGRMYTETDDSLLGAYFLGIHDMINPLSNYWTAVNYGIVSEVVDQLKSKVIANSPPNINKFSVQLLHLCLWAINHKSITVHNSAFKLLCVLAENGFDTDLPIDEADYEWEVNKRTQEVKILNTYKSAIFTHSEYSLSVFVEQVSYIFAQSHSSMTDALFNECFQRIDKIAVQDRRLWILSILKPWCKNMEISKDKIGFLDVLFKVTMSLSKQSGFLGDLKNIWQDLSLADWQKSKNNFDTIVTFCKNHCATSEQRINSREIILSLYQIQPYETVEKLVSDMSLEKIQSVQEDSMKYKELQAHQKADVLFLIDLYCETQIIQPVILQIPLIFIFCLLNIDKDPENIKYLLRNILLRATVESTPLTTFFDIKRKISISFKRKESGKKVVAKLTSLGFKEASLMFSYVDGVVSCQDLCKIYQAAFNAAFTPVLVNQIGDLALKMATKADETETFYKLISIFGCFMTPLSLASIQKLVFNMFYLDKILEMNRLRKQKSQLESDYVHCMSLILHIYKDAATTLSAQKQLPQYQNLFWSSVCMLYTPINELYNLSLDVLNVFRQDDECWKTFFSLANLDVLTALVVKFTPNWQGFQVLLLKAFSQKETEPLGIQFITSILDSDFDKFLDILPERRHLVALALTLPFIYREAATDADKVVTLLSSFVKVFNGDVKSALENTTLLKSNVDDYMIKLCQELVKNFAPHMSHVSEILYTLSYGQVDNQASILKLAKNLMDSNNLNAFVPITKSSLHAKNADVASMLISNSIKIAKERGDDQKVIASSKLFGTHNIPLKPSQNFEIDTSLKAVFDFTFTGINPNERQDITESFDFRVVIYDTTISPNSRNFLITKPLRDLSTDNIRNIDIHDVAPSQLRMEEEEKERKEQAKKAKSEQEKAKKEEYLRNKKEKEEAAKMNQHIVSCLQKFALAWREKAREIKDEQKDAKVMNKIEQLLVDDEMAEQLVDFCKNVDDLYLIDVQFLQEVMDFVEEEGRIESVLTSKDIIEKFVKNPKLILEDTVRNQVVLDYGSNQSDPKKTLFSPAFDRVCQRLENECLDRFLVSDQYKTLEAKRKRKHHK